MKKLFVLAIWVSPFAALAPAANAQTFTGNCAGTNCFGATFTLTINHVSGQNYTAQLDIATSAATYSAGFRQISAVDFKVSGIDSGTLTGAPGGTAGWTTALGFQAANNGCAPGPPGFLCSKEDTQSANLAAITSGGNTLTWTWNFTLGASQTSIVFGHIGAHFDDADGTLTNGNNVSLSTTTVPEPSSLILLGVGLAGVGVAGRRLIN